MWDGCATSMGHISVDPQLDATYHITSAMSPLIDAGYINLDHFGFGDLDIGDDDRYADGVDIGIREYVP